MSEFVLLVDKKDKEIGLLEKEKAHQGRGVLHRGFLVLIFRKKDEILLQKRSSKKPLFPEYWDGACASHPQKGEGYISAGKRRLKEELGFSCELKFLGKFFYFAPYGKKAEREICGVLKGEYDGEINFNPDEVSEIKWEKIKNLKKRIKKYPQIFTPWFRIAFRKYIDRNKKEGKIEL